MPAYDFPRSFLQWTSTNNNHSPRLQIEAACTLEGSAGKREFFLTAACAGETMYAERDLIHLPASEFAVIYCPDGEYVFFKWHADPRLDVCEAHRVGEAMTTHDGRGAPIVEMRLAMAHHASVRPLAGYTEIRQAILGNRPLLAQTQYRDEAAGLTVTLDYPVRVCNVAHGRERWQIDTGPIVLPDAMPPSARPIECLRPGYIVYNCWDWAEVIVRAPRSASPYAAASHFSESRRLDARNSLYCIERLPEVMNQGA
jgi:hypothetical protein